VGVVTSRDAAALRDILRVMAARWPVVDVVLFPTLVQGSEAPAQIVAALSGANRYSSQVEELDVLILARGGGSIEDLWAFNDENVARAVCESVPPVVTGVGHETDFTIADFVADMRASTPSAAAAAITPDESEVRSYLAALVERMGTQVLDVVRGEVQHLGQTRQRLLRLHPSRRLDSGRQALDDRERRLHVAANQLVKRLAERNAGVHHRLAALSPLAVLQRGYSIVQREDGAIVVSPQTLSQGEELEVQAAGGEYQVIVQSA
jgi:exodeoxyribonuclease VII large subunit